MEREPTVEAPPTPRPSENDRDRDYERLFEECAPIAFRSAYSVLRSEADAEDVAQDALLTVFERLKAGAAIDDPKAYVHRTAYHAALRALGRQGSDVLLADETPGIDDPSTEGLNRSRLILQATAALTPLQREALHLFHQQGYSQAEVAKALDLKSEGAARMQISRAEARVFHRYVELLGERPGRQAGCEAITRLIGLQLRGELHDGRAREELGDHLATCEFCRQTEEEAAQGRRLAALLPVPPADGIMARKQHVLRALRSRSAVAPTVGSAFRLGPLAMPLAAVAMATAIVAGTLVVRGQTTLQGPPSRAAVAAVGVPASAARVAMQPVAATNPCTPTRQGGFAYISQRELFYRASPQADPMQLTRTGGRVDTFAWQADGKAIAFLQGAEWSVDGTGTVYLISPNGTAIGQLASGVIAFAFAPDGAAVVTARPTYAGTTKTIDGYVLHIEPTVQSGGPSRNVNVPSELPASQRRAFSHSYPVPKVARVFPDSGLWWLEDGIYFQALGNNTQIDPTTGTVTPRSYLSWQDLVLNQAPPASMLMRSSWHVVSTCAGSKPLAWPFANSIAAQLDVSPDGLSGLATVYSTSYLYSPAGSEWTADIYLFTADGGEVRLTSDAASSLPMWQPHIARGQRE
jgi:RNA polymerase sigma factor (sigma-70 family)